MSYQCYVDAIVDMPTFTELDEAALMERILQPMVAKLRQIFKAGPNETVVMLNISVIGRTEDDLAAIYRYPAEGADV